MCSLLERSAHLTPGCSSHAFFNMQNGLSKTMVIGNTLDIEEPKNLKLCPHGIEIPSCSFFGRELNSVFNILLLLVA
jgi:hypothetical protein